MRSLRSGIKGILKGMGHFFTHWSVKKVFLMAAAVALCAAGLFFAPQWLGKNNAVDAMAQTSTRTVLLQKSSLTESVTVTGTVASNAVANVTSSSNYKITEVLVQAGDTVMEGQVLCVLDTTDLRDEIKKAQKNLADGFATAQRNYNDAVEARDEAHEKSLKGEVTLTDANTELNNATNAFNNAKSYVRVQQDAYNTANSADQTAGAALGGTDFLNKQAAQQTAQTNYALAQKAVVDAQAVYDAAKTKDPNDPSLPVYETAVTNAKATEAAAKTAVDTATAALNASQASYNALVSKKKETEAALTSAQTALVTAKQNCNYNALEMAYNTAVSTQKAARQSLDQLESAYKSTLKTVASAEDTLKKAKTSESLETLQKQLKDCEITATTSGTITSVNATVGSLAGGTAASGPLFTIQDTNHLKVAVTIDEYDIKNIQVGQRVHILSDATGEKQISGTVTQISLTATTSQSGTGFGAEITVDDTSSGLLIGMSAKAEIIINEKAGVYSVPYDAVGTDETGAIVVYAKQPDGTFLPLPVSVGMETDYYVEITGDGLAEGMEIRASADESSIDNTAMGMMGGEMQSMGGSVTMAAAPAPAMGGGGPGGRG